MRQGQPLKYGMEKPRGASPSHRCQDLKCAGPWDKASSACLTIPPPTAGRYIILSSYLPPFIADLGSTWAQPLEEALDQFVCILDRFKTNRPLHSQQTLAPLASQGALLITYNRERSSCRLN